MVIPYGRVLINRVNLFANPTRGQLNMENNVYPVPVRAGEFDFARLVRPSRPVTVTV